MGGQLVGSAQQHFNVGSAKALRVRLPGRKHQDRIAGVLCALNDLIENNRRRVELLEEMAKAIYREWFVHFRYLDHEDNTFVDSPLGLIPERWETTDIATTAATVTRGIAPKYADDGDWTVLNQKCIRNQRVSFDKARRQERKVPPAKQVCFGDVLINSTGVGTLGRAALYFGDHPRLTVDSHVTIVRPADPSLNPWFGLALNALQSDFEALGTGSTGQTELRRDDVGALPIAVPSSEVRARFADLVWPLLNGIDPLLMQARHLETLRDLLLPKLVTGRIDVLSLDLDAAVEASAA